MVERFTTPFSFLLSKFPNGVIQYARNFVHPEGCYKSFLWVMIRMQFIHNSEGRERVRTKSGGEDFEENLLMV